MLNSHQDKQKLSFDTMLYKLLVFSIIAVCVSFMPGPFVIVGLVYFAITKNTYAKYLTIISSVFFFIEVNFMREIHTNGNDLIWYTLYYKIYNTYDVTISQILNGDIYKVTPKPGEPIFHFLCYIFSNISNGNYIVFIAMNMFSTYFVAAVVISNVLKRQLARSELIFLMCIMQIFMFYDFGNAYNLVRQYMAMSFLLIAFYFSYCGRFKFCLLFCIVSVLTHNSAIVFIIPFLLLCMYNGKNTFNIKPWFIYLCAFFIALLFTIAVLMFESHYDELPDKTRGIFLKSVDYLIFFVSSYVVYKNKARYIKIWRYYAILILTLTVTHLSSFLPLRYFTYSDCYKWIGWYIIIDAIFFRYRRIMPLYKILYFLPLLYFYLKVDLSDFVFHDDLITIFLTSPYEYFITNNVYL